MGFVLRGLYYRCGANTHIIVVIVAMVPVHVRLAAVDVAIPSVRAVRLKLPVMLSGWHENHFSDSPLQNMVEVRRIYSGLFNLSPQVCIA